MALSAVSFNSRSKVFSELSNFFPFVSGGVAVSSRTCRVVLEPRRWEGIAPPGDRKFDAIECNSVEAAYQLAKYLLFVDPAYGELILLPKVMEGAGAAMMKSLGSQGKYLPWRVRHSRGTKKDAKAHYDGAQPLFWEHNMTLMFQLLWSKFSLNSELKDLLLSTNGRPLHEAGRPSVWTGSGGDGLGLLLMHIRSLLSAQNPVKSLDEAVRAAPLPKLEPPKPTGGKRARDPSDAGDGDDA